MKADVNFISDFFTVDITLVVVGVSWLQTKRCYMLMFSAPVPLLSIILLSVYMYSF